MIRYLSARDLAQYPKLADTMFRDRARQFSFRLNWDVRVDENGWERDQYDALDPLYVIWQLPNGAHGGSMRFLPTLGRTMVNEHFATVSGRTICDAGIWESTRFCLSPTAGRAASAALMLGGAQLGLGKGLSHAVGVFDTRMVRVYRQLGWSPEVLGTQGQGRDAISVGLWRFEAQVLRRLSQAAGLDPALARHWFNRAFPATAKAA